MVGIFTETWRQIDSEESLQIVTDSESYIQQTGRDNGRYKESKIKNSLSQLALS